MGCKSSKDAKQPAKKNSSPSKVAGRSPNKSPSKQIRQVREEELKKH